MALTETTKVDLIEITENGHIQVRIATVIEKDGVEISRTYHRNAIPPGEDVSGQDPKVQAIANVIWTPEVIASYEASLSRPTE